MTPTFDLTDSTPDRLPVDLYLHALSARALALSMRVRIRPADHAPTGSPFPMRLELTDRNDARRCIAGYTARDPEHAATGIQTLLAVVL